MNNHAPNQQDLTGIPSNHNADNSSATDIVGDLRSALVAMEARHDEDMRTILRLEAQYGVLSMEVERLLSDRDRLRRLYCHAQASTIKDMAPHQMAKNLGWDCFINKRRSDNGNDGND